MKKKKNILLTISYIESPFLHYLYGIRVLIAMFIKKT